MSSPSHHTLSFSRRAQDDLEANPTAIPLTRQSTTASNFSDYSQYAFAVPVPYKTRKPRKSSWRSVLSTGPSSQNGDSRFKRLFRGWRIVVLGSYLNLLLLLLPFAWALDFTSLKSSTIHFFLCVFVLVPLVKLHDIGTHEISLRLGGTRAGLINASLSNTISIVVAITALRKCELSVVQASLIGSMLAKLLLVLGLCFFAGGLRFSEQGWNATATNVHSSLLSISVGALLLPAAYHFTIGGGGMSVPQEQAQNILKMSHGVSIVLLFIYAAYLLFQLHSHSHLYDDSHNTSTPGGLKLKKIRIPVRPTSPFRFGKPDTTLRPYPTNSSGCSSVDSFSGISPPNKVYYHNNLSDSDCSISPQSASDDINPANSTVRLVVSPSDDITSSTHVGINQVSFDPELASPSGSEKDMTTVSVMEVDQADTKGKSCESEEESHLSWAFAIILLIIVTTATSVTADQLVESMNGLPLSKEWVALVLLPTVTSLAECMTAVNVSVKDKLTFSISVAVGSTLQTALFVIPLMVILGWIMSIPLPLLMDPFHSLVLYLAVQTMSYVISDGKSNWLEGLILICFYVVVAISFWFYGSADVFSVASLGTCIADP